MRLQGTQNYLQGKQQEALKWWQRSIDLAVSVGQRYDVAMTELEIGRRLEDTDRLQEAGVLFDELGAEWDAAYVREVLSKEHVSSLYQAKPLL